jgi:hypothetical protein
MSGGEATALKVLTESVDRNGNKYIGQETIPETWKSAIRAAAPTMDSEKYLELEYDSAKQMIIAVLEPFSKNLVKRIPNSQDIAESKGKEGEQAKIVAKALAPKTDFRPSRFNADDIIIPMAIPTQKPATITANAKITGSMGATTPTPVSNRDLEELRAAIRNGNKP